MTREEIEELKGLAASMGLYDDKNPCKRAEILGKAIKALEQEPKWIPVSERLPEKRGDYLTTQKVSFSDYVYRSVSSYALNLHDVDEYDFADKKRAGWYEYDSEGGYYEIDGVIAWMPLPEPYEEVQDADCN